MRRNTRNSHFFRVFSCFESRDGYANFVRENGATFLFFSGKVAFKLRCFCEAQLGVTIEIEF